MKDFLVFLYNNKVIVEQKNLLTAIDADFSRKSGVSILKGTEMDVRTKGSAQKIDNTYNNVEYLLDSHFASDTVIVTQVLIIVIWPALFQAQTTQLIKIGHIYSLFSYIYQIKLKLAC